MKRRCLAVFFLLAACLPLYSQALEISLYQGLTCKLEDGESPQILISKNGVERPLKFSSLLTKVNASLSIAKAKLARAKKTGKKKAIAKAKATLVSTKAKKAAISACKNGSIVNVQPTPSPTPSPTPTPVLTPTPGDGTNGITRVKVLSSLQLSIDPNLGWGQYFGYIYFTDIEVELPPSKPTVPEALQIAARAACLKAWDDNTNKAVRIFTTRFGSGIYVNLNPPSFWFPGLNGHYTTYGFNADPTGTVTAISGIWDGFYNNRALYIPISFDFEGSAVGADCFVGPETSAIYPNL